MTAMREITPETTCDYLREVGRIPDGRQAKAAALGWGVSNIVVRVDVEGEPPIVVKQSRERLRTKMLWMSRLDRIWIERDALELLASVLPDGAVPRVLFAEPDDYLFAMTCAPDESVVWKEQLLAGQVEPDVARRAGAILGRMHTQLRDHPGLNGRLADRTVFDELRIEPFYRTIARAHPGLVTPIAELIDAMKNPPDRTFVHADFSPKNILVHRRGLTVVDFETAHAGDPAFDIGFFLSHLTLKGFRDEGRCFALVTPFWDGYHAEAGPGHPDLSERSTRHAAACMLARVDGTSPVDYLSDVDRARVRAVATEILTRPSLRLDDPDGLLAWEVPG
jgi:5-methylthioribose kinase